MTKEELEKEATAYALEWGDKTDGTYACCRDGYLAGAEPREKRIAELEKENSELKTKVTALENANRAMVKELDDTTSGGLNILQNVVKNKEQLTKAKELLKQWLQTSKASSCDNINIVTDTEQFLSEVEK